MSQGIIPIDHCIQRFALHLKSHPRTILSAKYGDGKTFFLNEFSQKANDEYEVIRLCPVSYQVVDNKDVFELIKWDILFQLASKDILQYEAKENSKIKAFKYCMANNGLTLIENAAGIVSEIPSLQVSAWGKLGKATLKLTKAFTEARKDYLDYRNGNDEKLTEIIDEIHNIPVLECDLLTELIQDSIVRWKEVNPEKRMVLVFDDMDRLDPAHLFRIMNIITAHIDYGYKFGAPDNGTTFNCKFWVDNIVVVLDYNNLKSIYAHFYGTAASIEGYIGKFADRGIFYYSIKKEAVDYFYDNLIRITQIDKSVLEFFFSEELKKDSWRSVREMVSSLDDLDSQLYLPKELNAVNCGPIKIIAILKRMGVGSDTIRTYFTSWFHNDFIGFMKYNGMINIKINNGHVGTYSNGVRYEHGGQIGVDLHRMDTDGYVEVSSTEIYGSLPVFKPERLIDLMISYVG